MINLAYECIKWKENACSYAFESFGSSWLRFWSKIINEADNGVSSI